MIYKRKNSKFYYVAFYVKTPGGKLVKRAISTKTSDKSKALDIERELKRASAELAERKRIDDFLTATAERMIGATVERAGLSLSLVWEKYSTHHSQAKRTARTQNSKRIVWERFNRWLKSEYPQAETINDVSRDVAAQYLKTVQGKSAVTFNNEKNSLSSIWHVLAVDANIKENVWRLFSGAENDSVRHRDFTLEEIKSIIANASEFWRVAVAVAFYTGLRFKDVVHLRKTQIQGEYIILTPAKTKRKRKDVQIFIHPDLQKILDAWISQNEPDTDYIFPDAVNRYETRDFQMEFGKILRRCGIRENSQGGVGFHSLRHTFVTVNEEIGTDRKVIAGIVGHGSPVQTQHYSHDKKSGMAINKMPSLLEG